MNEKKLFAIDEVDAEINYLENQVGYVLSAYDGETYTFESGDGPWDYAIHFSFEENEDRSYEDLGYREVLQFLGKQGGYYSYLIRERSTLPRFIAYGDRAAALVLVKNRLDRFTFTVLIAVLFFFGYKMITTGSLSYALVLVPAVAMLVYAVTKHRKYTNFINKFKID